MLGLEHDFRIVDTHATLDPDESSVATHGRDISPERLEREMLQAGVVRAVASPGQRAAGQSYLRANNAVARLSIDRPFVAFARLNGPRDPSIGPSFDDPESPRRARRPPRPPGRRRAVLLRRSLPRVHPRPAL